MNYGWKPGRFRVQREDNVRVPDFILNCSAFLVAIASESDVTEYDFIASGFLLMLISEKCKGQAFFYFVTTAHALKDSQRYGIRINLKQGGIDVIPVERWYAHPSDSNADVAITPFQNSDTYSIKFSTDSLFRDRNDLTKYAIGIGDEVYFPGLFTLSQQESDSRNLPILRMGNIVMLPDVKLPSEIGLIDAYLVEARSLGGISGSPVFARRTMNLLWNDGVTTPPQIMHGLTGEVHLIGMMHGHWDVKESQINQVQVQPVDRGVSGGVNMGISLVIPISKIVETLNRADLVHMREEQEELWLNSQRVSTQD